MAKLHRLVTLLRTYRELKQALERFHVTLGDEFQFLQGTKGRFG